MMKKWRNPPRCPGRAVFDVEGQLTGSFNSSKTECNSRELELSVCGIRFGTQCPLLFVQFERAEYSLYASKRLGGFMRASLGEGLDPVANSLIYLPPFRRQEITIRGIAV
jgi:hypothetical protein